ncbi:hypothetical protein ASPFODRAFT_703570 [Aspergillus luchuensis CBS 106.47]|uniref:Fungal lipase-type domain-containing protein n=1 Tax=Aspergillus luchuensis (strain CBS 106.47) TaxID=1137211 RepID=A0A1M3T3I1_ASPLC|nr:hypothetical protein ASPFODRAFT_703570 [Aspergillus luchuensis CBS 106.47]
MTRRDTPKDGKAGNALRRFGAKLLLTKRPVVKTARVAATSSAGIQSSSSAPSSQHLTGTSRAAAEASNFLETVLATADPMTFTQECISDEYRIKLEKLPIHKVEKTDNAEPFQTTDDTWRLIELAAEKSVNAYFESPELPPDSPVFELTPRGDSKRILGTVVDSVLVVAVRGSTSVMDWMVNGNGEPITPSQSIGEPEAGYHKGYLAVAEAMQARLAEEVRAAVGAPGDMDLLFTGHSAGGGMAQLFYAMAASKSSSRTIATVVPSEPLIILSSCKSLAKHLANISNSMNRFPTGSLHCIWHPTDRYYPHPPAKPRPIPVRNIPEHNKRRRPQVFVRSPRELKARYPDGFKVPDPVVRISGPCVVLRDTDPTNVESCVFDAVKIPEAMLERKLFGNVSAHNKDDYLKRCRNLRSIAVSQDHMRSYILGGGEGGKGGLTGVRQVHRGVPKNEFSSWAN